ncbi:MAG: 30S ribosome-binding factor RbfA [Clostridia bacterium]|nr:30S ribosome-binding factor RbfA [Clostridia bacterium]
MERSDRVGDEMRTILSEIIRDDLKDPRIPDLVSVVGVRVTRDLSHAYAHISVLGDEAVRRDCRKALERATGFVRREVSRRMRLRLTPEIHFVFDNSIERGIEISRIIDQVIGRGPAAADGGNKTTDNGPERTEESDR